MVYEKTACLIAAAGRFGAMFSGADDDQVERLSRLGGIVGTAFQISDDIIDIDSDSDESGKLPGTDMREGVHTLPMLYALRETGPEGATAARAAGRARARRREVAEALTLLRASPGMAKAKEVAGAVCRAGACMSWPCCPTCAGRRALETLVDYTVSRHG